MTQETIATMLDISQSTVSNVLKRNNKRNQLILSAGSFYLFYYSHSIVLGGLEVIS